MTPVQNARFNCALSISRKQKKHTNFSWIHPFSLQPISSAATHPPYQLPNLSPTVRKKECKRESRQSFSHTPRHVSSSTHPPTHTHPYSLTSPLRLPLLRPPPLLRPLDSPPTIPSPPPLSPSALGLHDRCISCCSLRRSFVRR